IYFACGDLCFEGWAKANGWELFYKNGLKPVPIEYYKPYYYYYYLLLITTPPPLALIETVIPQHRLESCRIDAWKREA
ncbi:hypothetical protein V2E39_21670, partial [Chryseobacterium arthrosphaerae]